MAQSWKEDKSLLRDEMKRYDPASALSVLICACHTSSFVKMFICRDMHSPGRYTRVAQNETYQFSLRKEDEQGTSSSRLIEGALKSHLEGLSQSSPSTLDRSTFLSESAQDSVSRFNLGRLDAGLWWDPS